MPTEEKYELEKQNCNTDTKRKRWNYEEEMRRLEIIRLKQEDDLKSRVYERGKRATPSIED